MKQEYIITFSISTLVFATICVIMLMLMLPQQVHIVEGNINEYEVISKSQYTFETTKDISSENLKKQYGINNEDMTAFKNNKQYKAGNSDPFSPSSSSDSTGTNTTNTNTNNQNSTDVTTQTTTQDKITNSNGGVKNPPATNK